MSKALRLSDELVAQAETAGDLFHRSPPQQIEHWARIGRVMETALSYKAHEKVKEAANRQSLDSALEQASTPEGKRQARRIIRATSSRRAER